MRGVCVQCAAILMIEDQDGPNIVVQNSHTELVTSLFCVKIAHELRAVYADVIDKEHDKIEVLLEAKNLNDRKNRIAEILSTYANDVFNNTTLQ